MRFTYGDVSSLSGSWFLLELHGEASIEVYLKRIVNSIPGIFKLEPIELYVPLRNRDLNEFELLEGPFIYARSPYFIGLVRLTKVWGVVKLETKGGSSYLKDVIRIDDEYVKRLQELETSIVQTRVQGLSPGAGVRILDGRYRDFCAKVLSVNGLEVTLLIDLGFRKIELTTYLHNLRTIEADGSDYAWVSGLFKTQQDEFLIKEVIDVPY